jgi:hypothetical protein
MNSTSFPKYIGRWLFPYSLFSRTYIKLPFLVQANTETKLLNTQSRHSNSFVTKLPTDTNIIAQIVQQLKCYLKWINNS